MEGSATSSCMGRLHTLLKQWLVFKAQSKTAQLEPVSQLTRSGLNMTSCTIPVCFHQSWILGCAASLRAVDPLRRLLDRHPCCQQGLTPRHLVPPLLCWRLVRLGGLQELHHASCVCCCVIAALLCSSCSQSMLVERLHKTHALRGHCHQ